MNENVVAGRLSDVEPYAQRATFWQTQRTVDAIEPHAGIGQFKNIQVALIGGALGDENDFVGGGVNLHATGIRCVAGAIAAKRGHECGGRIYL